MFGVRSARPSQYGCQEYTEDNKYRCGPVTQCLLTLQYSSFSTPWYTTTTLNSNSSKQVTGIDSGKIYNTGCVGNGNRIILFQFAQLCTDLQERKQKWSRSGIGDKLTTNRMRRPPPWHWEILLNQHRQENPRRNRNKWEKREERQEWDRACHWQQRKRFLFTHSVFQSLGWGSAVVLTWSIYNDWGNHPYSYHWNTRRQCKEIFLSQSEEEINSKPKTNDSEQHQHNKEGEDQYCYSVSQSGCLGDHNCQCPQHTLYKENFCSQQSQNFFCPETNRSLFSFLWSSSEHKFLIEQPTDTLSDVLDIPEIQEFQDKDRIELPVVQSKFSVEVQPKDSLSDVLDTRDIHSNIQEFQGHKRLELQQDYENETELSIEGEAQVCEQDEDSGRPVKGDLKCSLNSELCNSLPASGLEQDAINTSDGLGLLQGETLFEENGIVECMKVSREIKGSEECVPCGSGILTKPQAVRSEEVKIKDCTSDDSGQSTSTSSNSSSHQLDKMTIEEFSDSLTKVQ
ncbi:hypothetical protein Hamer_G003113, partial [Homarus americanus]